MQRTDANPNRFARSNSARTPADERNQAWSRLLSALTIVRAHNDSSRPMQAALTSYDLGRIMLARCSSSTVQYLRHGENGPTTDLDGYVLLQLLVDGCGTATFDDADIKLQRGDICLIDLAQRTQLSFGSDCEQVNVLIPRELLQENRGTLHGRVLRSGQSLCRMLSEHLMQLLEMLPTLAHAHVDTMSRATLAVLRICLNQHADNKPAQMSQGEALLTRMLAYIDAQLGNPELGAHMLQQDFSVSRATVYRIFAEYNGVNQCIREKRLHCAFTDLSSRPHQQIGPVVFRWGFSCERQFQRAFSARFGMTPSAVRKQGALAMQTAPYVAPPSTTFAREPSLQES